MTHRSHPSSLFVLQRQDVKTLREDLTRHKESERGVEEQRRRMVDIMRGLEEQLRVATKDLHGTSPAPQPSVCAARWALKALWL